MAIGRACQAQLTLQLHGRDQTQCRCPRCRISPATATKDTQRWTKDRACVTSAPGNQTSPASHRSAGTAKARPETVTISQLASSTQDMAGEGPALALRQPFGHMAPKPTGQQHRQPHAGRHMGQNHRAIAGAQPDPQAGDSQRREQRGLRARAVRAGTGRVPDESARSRADGSGHGGLPLDFDAVAGGWLKNLRDDAVGDILGIAADGIDFFGVKLSPLASRSRVSWIRASKSLKSLVIAASKAASPVATTGATAWPTPAPAASHDAFGIDQPALRHEGTIDRAQEMRVLPLADVVAHRRRHRHDSGEGIVAVGLPCGDVAGQGRCPFGHGTRGPLGEGRVKQRLARRCRAVAVKIDGQFFLLSPQPVRSPSSGSVMV